MAGRVARTLLTAAALGLAAVVAVALLTWLTFTLDDGRLRTSVRTAFADGTLIPNSGQLFDLRRGDYLYNDCLILQSLLLGREDWRHSVIEATIYVAENPCQMLGQDVNDPRPTVATYGYGRYIFAARAASAPWIAWFGVERTKAILRATNYVVLVLALLLALRGMVSGARPRTLYAAAFLCAAALLVWYRLPYYALTLAHGFSDLTIAGFLLYTVLPRRSPTDEGVPMAAIVLGVVTGCFELLTGPILVAVGMAVLLDHAAAPLRRHSYRRAVLVGFGCVAGMLMAMLWQQIILALFTDTQPFRQFATHLALRLQLHQYFPIPIDPLWAIPENLHMYSPAEVFGTVINALPTLTYGSSIMAAAVFGGSIVVIIASLGLAGRENRPGCVIAAGVGLALPAWYFAFANHTVLHSLYMIRMAVLWPACASVALLFAFAPRSWTQQLSLRKKKGPANKGSVAGP